VNRIESETPTGPTETTPSPTASPRPTAGRERIVDVDVLRGVAVLGLMGIHILVFSQPMDPLGDMRAGLDYEGLNRLYIWFSSVFVFGKFHFLFALLFGASVMFFDRKSDGEKLTDGAGLWYRRMAWLAVIGLLHGAFLFFGDILLLYGICGMALLWWVRRMETKSILAIAAAIYCFGMFLFGGLMLLSYFFVAGIDVDDVLQWQRDAFSGSYLVTLKHNAIMFFSNNVAMIVFATFWLTTPIMMLGMVLARNGVLTGSKSTGFYAKLAAAGIGIGVPLSALIFLMVERNDFSPAATMTWATLFSPLAIPTGLGYLGFIMLLSKLDVLGPMRAALAAVGRMALTNYLLHSLCGAVIFHGWGFGLYAQLQFPELLYILFSIWTLNIVFSVIWLRLFRFGPMEWVWRSLTYMKPQPMLRAREASLAG
jgi:uncharacterized protein